MILRDCVFGSCACVVLCTCILIYAGCASVHCLLAGACMCAHVCMPIHRRVRALCLIQIISFIFNKYSLFV